MTAKRSRANSPRNTPPQPCATLVSRTMGARGEAAYLTASPVLPTPSLLTPSPPSHVMPASATPTTGALLGDAWVTAGNGGTPMQSPFDAAAAAGAAAAVAASGSDLSGAVADGAANGATPSFTLGLQVVRSARLAVAQRRSARVLPGGGDTTTAACFALGGLEDMKVQSLLDASSPAAPRDARLKVVERALKARVREHIVRLNGSNSKDMRACNLAAVRICTVAADILAAHAARTLLDQLHSARVEASRKDAAIAALQSQLAAVTRCRVCDPATRPPQLQNLSGPRHTDPTPLSQPQPQSQMHHQVHPTSTTTNTTQLLLAQPNNSATNIITSVKPNHN